MSVLTYVTGNLNKLQEVSALLKQHAPEINVINSQIDLPEYQETMENVSRLKVKTAYDIIKKPVMVEDTSLCLEALKGMPGPFIKWFGTCSGDYKFGHLKKMLDGFGNYNAEAITIVALYDNNCIKTNSEPKLFIGRNKGRIVEPRGPPTFGWDSVFEPDEGNGLTYAEMDNSYRNATSHRGKAIQLLGEYMQKIENYD